MKLQWLHQPHVRTWVIKFKLYVILETTNMFKRDDKRFAYKWEKKIFVYLQMLEDSIHPCKLSYFLFCFSLMCLGFPLSCYEIWAVVVIWQVRIRCYLNLFIRMASTASSTLLNAGLFFFDIKEYFTRFLSVTFSVSTFQAMFPLFVNFLGGEL